MLALDETVYQSLNTYFTSWEKMYNFSGAILVAHKNNILFNKGYGYANREAGKYNDITTEFIIASLTKTFTAVAILKLQEQFKLDINNTLDKYVPDYPRGDEISIHHLLSMTSGITNLKSDYEQRKQTITVELFISKLKQYNLAYAPGAQFNYSNSNYFLLAHIIEQSSGMDYGAYLKKHIFESLEMHHTYVDSNVGSPYQAIGYNQGVPVEFCDMSWLFGSGNIRSTLEDLYLFDRALHNKTILNVHSHKLLQTSVIKTDWQKTGYGEMYCKSSYGYGRIFTSPIKSRGATVGHVGGTRGWAAEMIRFLTSDVVLIVLVNHEEFKAYAKEFMIGLEAIIFNKHHYRID